MIGDFNDIKCNSENKENLQMSVTSFNLFSQMLDVLDLQGVKIIGGKYTWVGKRSKYMIMSRIDKAIAYSLGQYLKEVRKAISAMNPVKSSGPDEMTTGFYRQHWETIKSGVISHVKLFLSKHI